jgi:hypothetical protein
MIPSVVTDFADHLVIALLLGEASIMGLAALGCLRQWGFTLAEAGAFAALCPAMVFSLIFQVCFLVGHVHFAPWLELLLALAASLLIWRTRNALIRVWRQLRGWYRAHLLAAGVLSLAGGVLLIKALAAGVATEGVDFWSASAATGLNPLNTAFLRRGAIVFKSWGGGFFGWTAYGAIACATYALARRYAWQPTAATATMIVASMPRLVMLATTPGREIVPAAAGLLSLLALFRALEQPDLKDLALFLVTLTFGITDDALCLVFPSVVFGMGLFVFMRRHGAATWQEMMRRANWRLVWAVLPVVIFSQVWLFGANALQGHAWYGPLPAAPWAYNPDQLGGMAANLLRFLLEGIDFTQPVEDFARAAFGFSPVAALQRLHDGVLTGLLNPSGGGAPFVIDWRMNVASTGFGPFALLLYFAVLRALWRGPRRLRAVALALWGYLLLVSLIAAWQPLHAGYLTRFLVCSGFIMAYILPPWRLTRGRRLVCQILGAVLMVYTLVAA